MNPKRTRTRSLLLLALVVVFTILASAIFGATRLPFQALATLAAVFGSLGVVLTVRTIRETETRTSKVFFILTGIGAAGIPLCAILHNLL